MRLEVCQLTRREARECEHQSKKPNCQHHSHIPLAQAHAMVNRQLARWVRVGWSLVCEVVHWAAKMSGSTRVQQLVDGVDSGRKQGRKYPIPSHGGRGRDTKVSQINGEQLEQGGNYISQWA